MKLKRFEPKVEIKLIKHFEKKVDVFKEGAEKLFESHNVMKSPIGKKKILGSIKIMDSYGAMMVEAVSDEARVFLSRYLGTEAEYKEDIDLDYSKLESHVVKLTLEYVKWIIELMSITSEENYICIKSKGAYPVTFENEHFRVVLAPRVDEDE